MKAYWVSFSVSGDLTYRVEAETEEEAKQKCLDEFVKQYSPDSWILIRESDFEVEEDSSEEEEE